MLYAYRYSDRAWREWIFCPNPGMRRKREPSDAGVRQACQFSHDLSECTFKTYKPDRMLVLGA
ncbi:hypothetical protein PAXINDRAFT_182932, partial [Paxillus involutus ATCC 200175]